MLCEWHFRLIRQIVYYSLHANCLCYFFTVTVIVLLILPILTNNLYLPGILNDKTGRLTFPALFSVVETKTMALFPGPINEKLTTVPFGCEGTTSEIV